MHEGPYDQEHDGGPYDDLAQQARWEAWITNLPEWQFNALMAAERQRQKPTGAPSFAYMRALETFNQIVMHDLEWFESMWMGTEQLAKFDG